ncbi:MAG: hypothetical protein EOP45_00700 [Sphingobacteriaceae bacterium]|nr:MAG: hypothetical protein EOP45_00700 [Sphingobacteriaceae bacterium]
MKRQVTIILALATLCVSLPSYGGIDKLIKNVMPRGTLSNVTNSAVVKDQLAGHMTGGSIIIKAPVTEDLQPINLQAPKCSIGGLPCAAQFDLRGGAFSFVKSEEMMRHLRRLAENMGAYVGMMAIKTICPQCEDLMTWLEGVQRSINNQSILNCNDMMNKVQGIHHKMTASAEANRQSNLVMASGAPDMAAIAKESKKESNDPTDTNQGLKSQLGDNFNLVWKALGMKPASTRDGVPEGDLKEFLMSISGTIIITKDRAPRNLLSLVNKDLIEEYIGLKSGGGNEIELYECNEKAKCLAPNIVKKRISESDTLFGRVNKLLGSISEKVKANKGDFTEEEKNLIGLSSLPIVNKIQMDLALYGDSTNSTIRVREFVEALCYDVVTSYLTKMLQQTSIAVNELSYLQITDSGVFEKFNQQATETLRFISASKSVAFKRYDIIAQSKARMTQETKYFEMKFEEYISSNGSPQ